MFADNFLVHLPREREGRGEMGEGKGRGREWEGKESEGYGGAGNGNARKNTPKRNIFGIWERPLGLLPRVIHF